MFKRTILTILGLLGSAVALSLLITGYVGFFTQNVSPTEPTTSPLMQPVFIERKEPLMFPYPIEGTDLLVEQVICYDGPFLEDGSQREMKNVTAILLSNTGDAGILQTQIRLVSDNGVYCFWAEDIPVNSSVLVIETEAKQFARKFYYECTGNVICTDTDWLQRESIRLGTVGMDTLSVTNTTENTLSDLQIVYKSIYGEGKFYLGGISHTVVIPSLSAGETVLIKPRFFAAAYSCVLRISFQNE